MNNAEMKPYLYPFKYAFGKSCGHYHDLVNSNNLSLGPILSDVDNINH
jgi:hypothetical protein